MPCGMVWRVAANNGIAHAKTWYNTWHSRAYQNMSGNIVASYGVTRCYSNGVWMWCDPVRHNIAQHKGILAQYAMMWHGVAYYNISLYGANSSIQRNTAQHNTIHKHCAHANVIRIRLHYVIERNVRQHCATLCNTMSVSIERCIIIWYDQM